jgi:hypothetical protein
MGSIVEFNCQGCGFTTGDLRVGWGRAGRTRFWGFRWSTSRRSSTRTAARSVRGSCSCSRAWRPTFHAPSAAKC